MGIPSYFSYVLKNHKIIKKMIDIKCTSLFLDANSIIYDVIHENESLTESSTESSNQKSIDIYNSVYDKIMAIIDKIKPNKTYVAFDGVAT